MINTEKELKETLNYECKLYGETHKILFRPVLSEHRIAWKYVCLLRYEEYHTNAYHRIRSSFFKFLRIKQSRKYSLFFPINVIEKGLMIHHPHNIMVNAKHIGQNFSIQFNVSLVSGGHDGSNPTIGNNVAVGVGAVILGGIYIASGIAIGANSTVNKTFEEENIGIAGSPAKKISNNGSASWGGIKKMHQLLEK